MAVAVCNNASATPKPLWLINYPSLFVDERGPIPIFGGFPSELINGASRQASGIKSLISREGGGSASERNEIKGTSNQTD